MKKFLLPILTLLVCVANVHAAMPAKSMYAPAGTDTVRISATEFEVFEYDNKGNDWFVAMYSSDSTYLVCFDYVSATSSGTFTLKDMIVGYSWIQVCKNKQYIDYRAVTLTVQKNKDKSIDLNADILGSDGKVYIVAMHYVHKRPVVTPKDTVDYTFPEAELNVGTISFQLHTEDKPEVYFSTILYYNGCVEGTYTEDDIAPYGACIRVDSTWIDAIRYDLTITQTDYVYQAYAEMIGTDSILYRITLTSHSVQPKRTVDITINNMTIEDFTSTQGLYYVDGYNAQYQVTVEVTANSIADGEYTSGLKIALASADMQTSPLLYLYTLTTTPAMRKVQIDMLGKDTVRYRIDMAYIVPATKDTVEVAFAHSAELTHAKSAGNYQFYNYDDRYIASIDIHTDTLGGTFGGDDIDKYYSFMGVITAQDTIGVRVMDAKVVLSQSADTIYLQADVVGEDSILYKVSMFHVPPVAKDTVVLLIPSARYNDLLSRGAYQVHGYTPDSSYYLSITPFTQQIEGTYDVSEMYSPYSYIAHFDQAGSFTRIPFYNGEVVAEQHDRCLNMTGGILGKDTVFYQIRMTANVPLKYDSVSGEVDFAYTQQDQVSINTAYLADSSMILFDAVAFGVINNTYIRFNTTTTTDPVTIIPTGVYPINYSRQPGTVYAGSVSVDKAGNEAPAPSFFARTWMDGRIVPPLYFMVSGTVKVENRDGALFIEVDALNSYGRPIHITYDSDATAIQHTKVDSVRTRKIIRDGHILIRRGEEVFTLQGQRWQ